MKSYLYCDSLANFLSTEADTLVAGLKKEYSEIWGEYPDKEVEMSWKGSIAFLQEALKDLSSSDFTVTMEYILPLGNERVDLIIFGKKDRPVALVFELKGWRYAEPVGNSEYRVSCDLGMHIHPEHQLLNYTGKLHFSHSEGENFSIAGAVIMYGMKREECKISFTAPVFFQDEVDQLRSFILSHMNTALERDVVDRFLRGSYVQNKKLFQSIKEHMDEILKRSHHALAESGWGLSEEQLNLVDEILEDVRSGNRDVVYLVQGAPGSGKTLVAIHLLLGALSHHHSALLGYRNNRLLNSIRDVFEKSRPGLSSPVKFYSTGYQKNPGIAEPGFDEEREKIELARKMELKTEMSDPYFDLVIYDEAQRMTTENIHYAMKRGKITVFFFDEGQILNIEEEGTLENFKREAQAQKKCCRERTLKGFYRIPVEKYHEFVEVLITSPQHVEEKLVEDWKNKYEFRVFDDIEDMLSALRRKSEEGFKVALIASFTESPGDLKRPDSIKNLRIGYPLYSSFDLYKEKNLQIYWLMDPKQDYVPFWVEGESNSLKRCSSIYGCQGFETDYAGIIWGRDFVIREGEYTLGDNCEDNVGRPVNLKRLFEKAREGNEEAKENALRLLRNRYRIFLTRGIKGTYIFCEDPETKETLLRIYHTFLGEV